MNSCPQCGQHSPGGLHGWTVTPVGRVWHCPATTFKPFMLRGLTYVDALNAAKATGCAIRRNHWCAPVVIWNGSRAMLDDEGELSPFTLAREDRGATDWEMTPHPDAEPAVCESLGVSQDEPVIQSSSTAQEPKSESEEGH